jgi:hypothetical protein
MEDPAGSLKLSLPAHVSIVPFDTVPCIAVALDSQACSLSLDDKINTVGVTRLVSSQDLCSYPVAPLPNALIDVPLEPGFKPRVLEFVSGRGAQAIRKQSSPNT